MPAHFDVRLIDLKAHSFSVGLVTLTCPCDHKETVPRIAAMQTRMAHAAICPACQIPDPDLEPLAALSEGLKRTEAKRGLGSSYRPRALELLAVLREQGFDITPTPPKETS